MSSYALFRLPRERRFTLLAQHEGEPELLPSVNALNGKSGYVIAPFHPSAQCPVVLIHPDEEMTGDVDDVETLTEGMLETAGGRPETLATGMLETADGTSDDKEPADGMSPLRKLYSHDFRTFHDALQQRRFSKLVLMRSVAQQVGTQTSLGTLFRRACQRYPRTFVALVSSPVSGTWLMATPEILLSGDGAHFSTMALAGTMRLTKESAGFDVPGSHFDETTIRWSKKNVHEQQCVVTYLEEQLSSFSSDIKKTAPYTARAGHLIHLRTDFSFTVSPDKGIGDLLDTLHPTPAVCGLPKAEAERFIREKESGARRYYSGFSGLLSHEGDTRLFVSLRCMSIGSGHATLYAGGGLLPESEEQQEWEETEAKMETMKKVLDNV